MHPRRSVRSAKDAAYGACDAAVLGAPPAAVSRAVVSLVSGVRAGFRGTPLDVRGPAGSSGHVVPLVARPPLRERSACARCAGITTGGPACKSKDGPVLSPGRSQSLVFPPSCNLFCGRRLWADAACMCLSVSESRALLLSVPLPAV